ncbi:rhomboid family intramembrane serine protease [Riemerella anatipestifer]|uniref:rhomboid family intramembrane serine protease n=1 Tax=Riemerella anatipestifer TaxID=34085 RepID=UPI00129E5DC3|nr:rhomboid family intramembrane serine protease [Riemerella anatipestifer]MRM97345.1 rhomboid family intramembrane serine protease [Riemerella anatipestifer]MRN01178.1 rhomboid family intramembrane serine protease [Riemerella anatipestifer]MRN03283.1 rhomboid family intramembrane serine protease [Riemerella anatipestifer]
MFKNESFRSIKVPIIVLSAIWIGFLLQSVGLVEHCQGALIPLAPEGLKGVLFSPFLHSGLDHIWSNSVPLGVLLFLLYEFYPKIANVIFLLGWLSTGFLVWFTPQVDLFTGEMHYTCIIGASGIVYMLAFFLFFSGIFRWNMKLLTISLLVALYYGSLIWGIFPEEFFSQLDQPSQISWQSHLVGAVVGVVLAFMYRKQGEKKHRFIWQYPNYYSEKDDKLWQAYKAEHPEDFEELPKLNEPDIWEELNRLRRQ